ncbi:MAG: sigma-70 family RNA polymerase sigma factor [Anaerolineales bacterium]|nr:sigma-70 family RNA polymerase sigma factor [Chloroflexota bacterium]MBL6979814.1 sigma-70 family RNA polymerase sigma factor [Anaerolineales bacterium]
MDRAREEMIVRRAQAGDTDAFAELVLEHQRFVFNLALRALSDPQDAEDLSQEAFIRVWKALPRFRRKSRFQTWLYRIVMNLCYNRLPRLRKELSELGDEVVDFLEDSTSMHSPVAALDAEELRGYLHEKIDALPESQRLLITMRFQKDLSYAEISEIVGIPLGTVKTGIFRARKQLLEALRQFEEEPL